MMNNKVLFIVFHGINKAGGGIGKKIRSQVDAFRHIGTNILLSFLEVDKNTNYIGRSVDGKMLEEFNPVLGRRISWVWRLKFKNLIKYIVENKIGIVYIRYSHFANPFFIHFLKKLKRLGVFILLEIPTYPYDNEYENVKLSMQIIKKVEENFRNSFYKYVDRIVTFSNAQKIFNVDTINIHNGVDLSSNRIKKSANNGNNIHLIAMAVINKWHGYDRIIEGLKEYYAEERAIKVFLDIVGDSDDDESKKYKQMVTDYKLSDYVCFNGFKSGDELNELFDNSDLAIGPLGFHRVGLTYVTPIKFGEYCARGIPFVYSGTNDLFEKQPFIIKIKPDESPVRIIDLISFTKTQTFGPKQLRNFAEENLTWEIQMQKIIDEVSLLS